MDLHVELETEGGGDTLRLLRRLKKECARAGWARSASGGGALVQHLARRARGSWIQGRSRCTVHVEKRRVLLLHTVECVHTHAQVLPYTHTPRTPSRPRALVSATRVTYLTPQYRDIWSAISARGRGRVQRLIRAESVRGERRIISPLPLPTCRPPPPASPLPPAAAAWRRQTGRRASAPRPSRRR